MKKILFYFLLFCIYIISTIPIGLFLYTIKTNKDINIFSESGFHAYEQCLKQEFRKIIGNDMLKTSQISNTEIDFKKFKYNDYLNFYERINAVIQIQKVAKNKREIELILNKDDVQIIDKKWVKDHPEYLLYEKDFKDLQNKANSVFLYYHKGTLNYPKPWHVYVFYDKQDRVIGLYYENYDVSGMSKLLEDLHREQ